MKTSRKNQNAVTIKDLEREITDLRIGIENITKTAGQFACANHALLLENGKLKVALSTRDRELADATAEVDRQREYQSRAHETIERLVKKMAYAPEKA